MSSSNNQPRLARLLRNWLQEDLRGIHPSNTNIFGPLNAAGPKLLDTLLLGPSSGRAAEFGIVAGNPPISSIELNITSYKSLATRDPATFRYSIACGVSTVANDNETLGPMIGVDWITSASEDLTSFSEALQKLREGTITYRDME